LGEKKRKGSRYARVEDLPPVSPYEPFVPEFARDFHERELHLPPEFQHGLGVGARAESSDMRRRLNPLAFFQLFFTMDRVVRRSGSSTRRIRIRCRPACKDPARPAPRFLLSTGPSPRWSCDHSVQTKACLLRVAYHLVPFCCLWPWVCGQFFRTYSHVVGGVVAYSLKPYFYN
jgi:hypothetical protein